MKLRSLALAGAMMLACALPAAAQTSATLSVKDAAGTTRSLCETADGLGNLTPCLRSGAATASGVSQLHSDLTPSGGLPVSGPLTAAQLAAAGLATAGGKIDTVIVGSSADRGAVVGTTAVTLLAANVARRGFSIQVQSASASCYMNGLGTATADYHSLQIGGSQPTYYETKDSHVGQGAVSLICTAASTPVYSREW